MLQKRRTIAQDVRRIFGNVDEPTVDRIVQTGASMVEIGEALVSIEGEQDHLRRQPLSSGRVARVRAIIAALLWPGDPDEVRPTLVLVDART